MFTGVPYLTLLWPSWLVVADVPALLFPLHDLSFSIFYWLCLLNSFRSIFMMSWIIACIWALSCITSVMLMIFLLSRYVRKLRKLSMISWLLLSSLGYGCVTPNFLLVLFNAWFFFWFYFMLMYLLSLLINIVLAALLPALSFTAEFFCPKDVLREVDEAPSPSLLTCLLA